MAKATRQAAKKTSDDDEDMEDLRAQQQAQKAIAKPDYNTHLQIPEGVTLIETKKEGIRLLNFLRYPKKIPGGVYTGKKFAQFREYATHTVGPLQTKVICPLVTHGKTCTLCKRKGEAFRTPGLSKDDAFAAAQPFFTSKRRIYNVTDAEHDPTTVQLFDVAENCFPEVLDAELEMLGEDALGWNSPANGRTLKVKFVEKSAGEGRRPYRTAKAVKMMDRTPEYTEEELAGIVEQIIDLDTVLVPVEDREIVRMFDSGEDSDEDEDEEADLDEELDEFVDKAVRKPAKKSAAKKTDDDDDFGDDEEEEEAPAKRPAAKKVAAKKPAPKKTTDDDDDDFGDDEEEEEAPVSRSSKKPPSKAAAKKTTDDDDDDFGDDEEEEEAPAKRPAAKKSAAKKPASKRRASDDDDDVPY